MGSIKLLLKLWVWAYLLLGLSACQHAMQAGSVVQRENSDFISLSYANWRQDKVRDVSYQLTLAVSERDKDFLGSVIIDFDLLAVDAPLTVDFSGGKVKRVKLNGRSVNATYNGWYLTISPTALQTGRQQLQIDYSHPYSNSGVGLHRFVDPLDDNVYLYTQFEPYHANEVFPSFDQPNIKGRLRLTVSAPAEWQLISSVKETRVTRQGEQKLWQFPESPLLSTYTLSLHAGPFYVWQDQWQDIPLRLFARKSFAEHVDSQAWFTLTKQGLTFYEDYYAIPYPFKKYDQLLVPEFYFNAMENAAAVTFAERLVKRGSPTLAQRERLAYVIMHELAHMWFGNLVTMHWWDDLWLNESFATLMAYMALVENTEYKDAWQRFYYKPKRWAYKSDQMDTTHPISLPVTDSKRGFANFDGITYGKGAAVLRQLSFLIGEAAFQQGVGDYLRTHAYGNTRLNDFIQALQKHAPTQDLQAWAEQWLRTAGVNTVQPEYACEHGRLTQLVLHQSASQSLPLLREHYLQLALFKKDNGKLTLHHRMPIVVSGQKTVLDELQQLPCPDLVLPNYGDWAYIKTRYPSDKLLTIAATINQVDDPLARGMLWSSVWDGVQEARLPLSDFIDILAKQLPHEDNMKLAAWLARIAKEASAYMQTFAALGWAQSADYLAVLETMVWERVIAATTNQDMQKNWLDAYINIASTPLAKQQLLRLLDEQDMLLGFRLGQERRWQVIKRLNSLGARQIESLFRLEKKRDDSDAGKKAALAVQAAAPGLGNKRAWLKKVQGTDNYMLPLAKLRVVMAELFQPNQAALKTILLKSVLQPLSQLNAQQSEFYLALYARYLLSGYCHVDSLAALEQAITQSQQRVKALLKGLIDARQDDLRCIAMFKLVHG